MKPHSFDKSWCYALPASANVFLSETLSSTQHERVPQGSGKNCIVLTKASCGTEAGPGGSQEDLLWYRNVQSKPFAERRAGFCWPCSWVFCLRASFPNTMCLCLVVLSSEIYWLLLSYLERSDCLIYYLTNLAANSGH